ncbi:hypothetical protein ACN47E_009748 [Coniothyrium glycines]
MRFQSTVLAVAASLAFASAQDLSSVPTCAIPCLVAAIPGSGCTVTDVTCQCTTGREAIANSLTSCAPSRCSAADTAALEPALAGICAAAGVAISSAPSAAASSAASAVSSAINSAISSALSSAATSALAGTRTASGSASPTGSVAQQSTAAAASHVVGLGAVAMGVAAVLL